MVSPELLRRYAFFGFLDDAQLKAVAMIFEELAVAPGDVILEPGQPAAALYFLITGSVELSYVIQDELNSSLRQEIYISDINPGEIFGISALIEPYQYTGLMRATSAGRVLKINAAALRALCEVDTRLAYGWMRQTAKAAMERLQATRIQLAAARA
jgi:CRP-like cAMP-binding protein